MRRRGVEIVVAPCRSELGPYASQESRRGGGNRRLAHPVIVLVRPIQGVNNRWTGEIPQWEPGDTPGGGGSICQDPGIHVTYYLFAPQGSGEAESFTPLKRRTTSHSTHL
jgi:hypothetical protein